LLNLDLTLRTCAGDIFVAFTMSDYRYDYSWFQPLNFYVEFEVRTCSDGHILLGTYLFDETNGYEIVLGGYDNTKSDIRRGSHGPILLQVDTPDIMNCDEFLSFWVRWGNSSLEIGSGRLDEHVIMRLSDPQQPAIKSLSVSSWITAPAEYHFPQTSMYSARAYTTASQGYQTVHRSLLDARETVFKVRSASDAKVALLSVPGSFKAPSYEITIGAEQNTLTVLRCRSFSGDVVFDVDTAGILSVEELRPFWISWVNGTVSFGVGEVVGYGRRLRFQDPDPTYRKYVHSLAVASGPGTSAEWEFGQNFDTSLPTPIAESTTVISPSPTAAPAGSVDDSYLVYTDRTYDFDHAVMLTERKFFVFSVIACTNVGVLLSYLPGAFDLYAYNVTIGAYNNTKIVIQKMPPERETYDYTTSDILSCDASEARSFWITWSDGTFRIGRGNVTNINEMCSWNDPQPYAIHSLALASRDANKIVWRFPKDSGITLNHIFYYIVLNQPQFAW
jgi:hypothetical protein